MAYRFPFRLEGERRQNCSICQMKWNMKKVTKKGYKLLLEKIYLLLKVDSVKRKKLLKKVELVAF